MQPAEPDVDIETPTAAEVARTRAADVEGPPSTIVRDRASWSRRVRVLMKRQFADMHPVEWIVAVVSMTALTFGMVAINSIR